MLHLPDFLEVIRVMIALINSISIYNTNYKSLRGLSPFEGLGASA